MVGEEYGWVPLSGLDVLVLTILITAALMIPGFLLSLALFPKRAAMAMSERFALSLGLGLAAPLVIFVLNTSLKVPVSAAISWMVFAFLCIAGFVLFLNRGGTPNLIEWYRAKSG